MTHVNLIWTLVMLLSAPETVRDDGVMLSTTGGSYVRLADLFRGRPTVLFFEDKDSTALNQRLKDVLFATGKERGLLDAVSIVAVANLKGYDWFPARNFVVSAVKDSEKSFGLPIYLDWSGALTRAPWALKPDSSTVVLLDRAGAVKWKKQGRLGAHEIDEVLTRLGELLEPK